MKSNSTKIAIVAIILVAAIAIGVAITPSSPVSNEGTIEAGQSRISLVSPSGITASVGEIEKIKWSSENYLAPTVSLALIRKVSDSPATYELVRTISASTANDGLGTWVPTSIEAGKDLLIQIGCTASENACTAGVSGSHLAVVNDGGNSNTAAAYKAIEDSENK